MLESLEIVQIAAYLGAAISVSFASLSAGYGEGYTAGLANFGLMRQPKAGDQLTRSMLVSQAVTETGAIFSLVVSLLLLFGGVDRGSLGLDKAAALLAAGLAMGLGSVGPGFGSGYTGGYACLALSRMPKKHNEITGNMLIGQALAQASSIFALVVALLLIYAIPEYEDSTLLPQIIRAVAYLGAGLCIGLGTLGPGTAIGFVAGRASDMIGRYPRQRALIMRTMFVGAAVSESTAIYSLVIAFLLMYAL
jgi:F0F1-type ATP synthase membrane subunit c/vacuolar-type H+-ATPase subunit K